MTQRVTVIQEDRKVELEWPDRFRIPTVDEGIVVGPPDSDEEPTISGQVYAVEWIVATGPLGTAYGVEIEVRG